ITEFSAGITAGSGPYGITAGPDGNLWFTEYFGNRIGRITPAGVVTEFRAGLTGFTPSGIAIGPDGNLWFTEDNADRVGKLVLPPRLALAPASQTLAIGGSASLALTLNTPQAGPTMVALTSSEPNVLAVPATVPVSATQTTAHFR